jgi:hypothetical protein
MQLARPSRRARLAVLVAAASILVPGTRAQDHAGAYRAPALGTEFIVSDTSWFRVVDALPDAVTTENADHAKTTWLGGLVTRAMSAEDRARLMGFFPLTPGARFAYELGSASDPPHRVLTVVGDEFVQVGGRAIPVVRVTRHQIDVAPVASEGEYTFWFAPEYGFPLKQTYRHIAGAAPNVSDWQVTRIVPPPGLHGGPALGADGVWRLSLECPRGYLRLNSVMVKDGVVVPPPNTRPSNTSTTQSELRMSRVGDEIELKGTWMNAGGEALVISAHGTLIGARVSGTGVMNVRTGCAFTAERL